MNHRYMDFIPTKRRRSSANLASLATPPSPHLAPSTSRLTQSASHPAMPTSRSTPSISRPALPSQALKPTPTPEIPISTLPPKPSPSSHTSQPKTLNYGVIEEYRPIFKDFDVEKRPLFDPETRRKAELAKLKAKKLTSRPLANLAKSPTKSQLSDLTKTSTIGSPANLTTATTPAASTSSSKETPTSETFKTPKTPFINTAKIDKRPLSKNVYHKPVEIKEEPAGPIAIITPPEKEARAGFVVAIILTIILGAIAGTVAFLVLPR